MTRSDIKVEIGDGDYYLLHNNNQFILDNELPMYSIL